MRAWLDRRTPSILAALLGIVLGVPADAPLAAQVSPADSAAVLLEAARTFEVRGEWEVAEPLYRLVVERFPQSPAAAVARERLAAPREESLGDGRVALQVWSTLYGAWLGIAIPGALGADSEEPYGLGLLVGGPTGFIVGRNVGRATDLTEGQASIVSLGAWWGTWQGFGWREVFDLGVRQQCDSGPGFEFCYDVEDSGEETFAAMILGGAAGVVSGALLADRDITPGAGTLVNFGALWGTWFGFAGGIFLGLEDDDLLAATLIGGNSGLLASALLAPRWRPTRSRARLVSIAGVLGGLAGAGLDLLVQPESERAAVAIPLAGSIAGLLLGAGVDREEGAGASPDDGAEAGSGGAPALRTSLVDVRDGGASVGLPLPTPTWVALDRPDRTVWRPAMRIGLLRARF